MTWPNVNNDGQNRLLPRLLRRAQALGRRFHRLAAGSLFWLRWLATVGSVARLVWELLRLAR